MEKTEVGRVLECVAYEGLEVSLARGSGAIDMEFADCREVGGSREERAEDARASCTLKDLVDCLLKLSFILVLSFILRGDGHQVCTVDMHRLVQSRNRNWI